MRRTDIAAVIFDWGGTITPWHDLDPLEQWLAVVDDHATVARLHDAVTEVWTRSRDEHRSATLEEVFRAADVAHTDDMLAAFYRWWEPHTFADPDAHGLFSGLREYGIKVGVLSNTIWSRAEHERIFERDGLADLIDGAVYTSEIPWTKPHPEAFGAALAAVLERALALAPSASLYVNDFNVPARRMYQRLGMREVATLQTVLF